ncbi:MAG: hypothetical protein N2691_02225 [Patescibacteria group bacterium]|nr:hypothetical protein [Patescibacteria group bacterium]
MGIKEACVRFLEYCELDKNLTLRTVRMYSYYIRFFRDWLLKQKGRDDYSVLEITDEDIRQFRLYISHHFLRAGHIYKLKTGFTPCGEVFTPWYPC